ncbi:hypothetical protein SynMITS9220_01915 [Synechococcus sp. MIT S9220]|nr:hypothetical protein SynMITS9220_01915 [Synechococcus sp. MIT S9220]
MGWSWRWEGCEQLNKRCEAMRAVALAIKEEFKQSHHPAPIRSKDVGTDCC